MYLFMFAERAAKPPEGGGYTGQRFAGPADVAQLVEHFTRNEGVPGSSPGVGFERRCRIAASLQLFYAGAGSPPGARLLTAGATQRAAGRARACRRRARAPRTRRRPTPCSSRRTARRTPPSPATPA